MTNNKIHKLTLTAIAAVMIASGCSPQNDMDNNGSSGAEDNNGQVTEQPHNSSGNNTGANDANAGDEGQNAPGQAEDATDDVAGDAADDAADNAADDVDAVDGEVTATEISEQITAEVEMGALMTLEDEQVKDMYGIDPAEWLEEGIFRPAMMNVQAYEVTVVKLKSDEAYEEVEAAMEKRAEDIQKTFETYLPNQYEAAKQYQIIRQGDFVLFSITPDQDKAAEIFNSFFTE